MTDEIPDPPPFEPLPSPLYATCEDVASGVRRVLARNPSAFTATGTGTYIVGSGTVAVIDPGPDLPEHLNALLAALRGEIVSHIVVTHTHRDHSPAAPALKAATGARIVGCPPIFNGVEGTDIEQSFDASYAPDQVLADGESICGPGWTLTAVHTPGHSSNHVCYAFEEAKALFTGDHVMGWSTSVVVPPDGDMGLYIDSLRKLLGRDDRVYYPTHGAPVSNPHRLVRGIIGHRRLREGQIVALLREAPHGVGEIVARLYVHTPASLHGAAALSVLAHLIDLGRQGRVEEASGVYALTRA